MDRQEDDQTCGARRRRVEPLRLGASVGDQLGVKEFRLEVHRESESLGLASVGWTNREPEAGVSQAADWEPDRTGGSSVALGSAVPGALGSRGC